MVVCRCQVSASFARMSRGSSVKFDIFKNASGSSDYSVLCHMFMFWCSPAPTSGEGTDTFVPPATGHRKHGRTKAPRSTSTRIVEKEISAKVDGYVAPATPKLFPSSRLEDCGDFEMFVARSCALGRAKTANISLSLPPLPLSWSVACMYCTAGATKNATSRLILRGFISLQ